MTIRKISQTHVRSLICRKHLEIITFITLVALLCVLVSTQLLKSYQNIKVNYVIPSNISQMAMDKTSNEEITVPSNLNINLSKTSESDSNELLLKMQLKNILNCSDSLLSMEKMQYGKYWLIKNYIRGRKSTNMGCAESITYTTNGDYMFMENLPTVVKRWSAPVSFAIYAPGDDYDVTMNSILYALYCLPESELIRDYVTFHIYFPNDHLPSFVAKNEEEALQWPYDCELQAPYRNVNRLEMYKTMKNLTYPINVGRNIARKTANTYFIFACDIELYPSLGLVDAFLEMVVRDPKAVLEGEKPKVFVLPVFEVQRNATLPDNKQQLQHMLNNAMAIPFHEFVCSNCHMVPKQKQWTMANSSVELEVFTVGKRYDKFVYWEPFYISDNREPIFDERVTWEGQSNKRIQNYAMCLLDYEYHILHPAFLVHAPGIKVLNVKSKETKTRLNYAAAMNKIIRRDIIPEYAVLYGKNKRCVV